MLSSYITLILAYNQMKSGNLDTSAHVLISVLYFYHKINEIQFEWWLHVGDITGDILYKLCI